MTQTETKPYIIDGDSHALEPPDLWDEYLEPEYRERAIRITSDDVPGGKWKRWRPSRRRPGRRDGQLPPGDRGEADLPEMALELKQRLAASEQLIVDGQVIMTGGLAGLGGVEHHRSTLPQLTYLESAPKASYDTDARLALYQEWGIEGGVVYPTVGILWDTPDAKLADAYCRAYNNWAFDHVGGHHDRIFPMAHIPIHDPKLALTELRRNLKRGFRGVFLAPEKVGSKSPSDPEFDPLWHEMEDAGLPVCLHVIVRFSRILENPTRNFSLLTEPSRTYAFGMGATYQIIPAMASLIMNGWFDRFPKLKLLCVEAGAGWAPYIAHRLDEKYEHFGFAEKTKMAPSEYMKRNVYYVVEPREKTIDSMMDVIGESQFIWGSDYPHIDSSIDAIDQIRKSTASLSEHRRKLVLGENARALYQLD